MALTTTQPPKPWTTHNTTVLRPHHYPTPSPSALLQRRIEDTLIRISSLPESSEKMIIDLGSGSSSSGADRGGGWFAIQCNQLALFMQLQELVEQLSPEEKGRLIGGLHPAMSVQERKALGLVLERGLRRNVVPRPLEVRKVGAGPGAGAGAGKGGREKLYTAPALLPVEELVSHDSPGDADGLVFPELTKEEMLVRERELASARLEAQGEDATDTIETSLKEVDVTTTAQSKQRRQEIAKMLSQAAKKLQVQEGAGASDLASPIQSPGLKEGLNLIKSATSALRAYTDVTPREVAIKAAEGAARPSQELPRVSRETHRSGKVLKSATSAVRAYADVTPREVAIRGSEDTIRPSQEVYRVSRKAARPRDKELPPRPTSGESESMRSSDEGRRSSVPVKSSAEPESTRPVSVSQGSDKCVTPCTSPVPPSEDLVSSERLDAKPSPVQKLLQADTESLKGLTSRITPAKFRNPPPIPSTAELHRFRNNPFPTWSDEHSQSSTLIETPVQQLPLPRDDAATSSGHRITPVKFHSPPPVPSTDDFQRPRSDPSRGFCPWPETFFTSPRAAPEPPRSISLPHPPPKPKMPPLVESLQSSKAAPAVAQGPSHGRKGSIAAARAGIADRIRQQQTKAVSSPRSSVLSGRWSQSSDVQSRRASKTPSGSVLEEVEGETSMEV